MSTTLTRPPDEMAKGFTDLRLDPASVRRRPALALGSLALLLTCVAVFATVYSRAGAKTAVLAIAHVVPQGTTLTAGDITVVEVSTSAKVAVVPASEVSTVVGREAAEDLDPGTLLAPQELVAHFAPSGGYAIVGIEVKSSQIPASGVSPGDTVDVVLTGLPGEQETITTTTGPTTSAQPDGGGQTAGNALGSVLVSDVMVTDVVASPPSSGSDSEVVSVLAPYASAATLASASAAGQAALVVVSPGS